MKKEPITNGGGNKIRGKQMVGPGELVISWWNGGGRLVSRIEVNPELRAYLATKPDIFVYGESMVYKKTQKVHIPGYKVIIHVAKRNELRRGLAVFYQEKYFRF